MKNFGIQMFGLFIAVLFAFGIGIVACTDTQLQQAAFSALGTPGYITCYSGNTVILDTESTGKIFTVEHSDGWEFKDSKDGKFVRVSGACVIRN
jgi:hypothetical protein